MLTKIRIALIPCLLTTLWSSCGSAMELDVDSEDDLDLPPVQPLPLSVLGLAPSKNTPVKPRKHYGYLLIKYGYSDKYMNDLNYYGEYKVKDYAIKSILGYEITPTVGSEVQRWQTNWNARRETYKNSRKEYNRAIKTDDTDRKKKATADFQPILRQVLRKRGSLEAICMVQKIEEEIQKQQMNQIKREFNKSQEYRDYVQAKANLATNDVYPDFITAFNETQGQLLCGELAKELKQLGFYNSPEEFSEIFNEIDNNPNVEPLNQELIETDLYKTFQSEFKNIRKFMYYSESSKKTDDTLEPFDLDLQEIKPAIAHLRRLISCFKKNNEIQSEVNLSYNSDYLPETSSTWSQKQWENWWNGNKIEEVKRDIKVSVEADHPHHSFRVRFLGRDPSEKDLQSIGEKELVLYLTNNLLVCKIKDKNHKEINHVEKTGTTGLKLSTYKSLVEALSKEETGEINSETSWKVLNYALICGYLPDTFSVEEMSRMRKDRKEVLDILLLKKGWEIDDGIWQKKGRPAVKPELPESALTEEDRTFLKYWKPFSIDNNLFTKIETHLNPILKEKPIVTLEEIGEDSKTVWKNYPAPIQLDALRLNQYKLSDQTYPQKSIAYADLKPHRQGMLECMKAVKNKKAIKRIKEKFMEYSEEDLKTYNKSKYHYHR